MKNTRRAASAQRVRELARRHPSDHLLPGVGYGRARLVDVARTQLSEGSRQTANRPEIRRLLESLRPAK